MLWGLPGECAELLQGAGVRGIPLVICSFGGGGPELLNARNLVSGCSCLFHLLLFPLTRQTHAF